MLRLAVVAAMSILVVTLSAFGGSPATSGQGPSSLGCRIRFFNQTTLRDVTDVDVDVFLIYADDEVSSLPLCRTFVRNGRLWVDCAPPLHCRYAAPVPDDVLISRNEECLTTGRYGLFVPVWSRLGRLAADLVAFRERKPPVSED